MASKSLLRVAVIAGVRTPFVKARTAFKNYSALDLGVHAVNGLLEKHAIDPQTVEEMVYGVVIVDPKIPHLAREVVFRTRLPSTVRALTVSNNCITGTYARRVAPARRHSAAEHALSSPGARRPVRGVRAISSGRTLAGIRDGRSSRREGATLRAL